MRMSIVWLVMVLYSGVSLSEEAMVVLLSTVKGNQEQPRVMYIVPWHRPGDSSLEYQPMDNLHQLISPGDDGQLSLKIRYPCCHQTVLSKGQFLVAIIVP
jgi:hypothetical protein